MSPVAEQTETTQAPAPVAVQATTPVRAAPRRTADVVLTALTALLVLAAIAPLSRVFEAGAWVWQSIFVCIGLLAVGALARAFRAGGLLATVAQVAVAVALLTAVHFPATAVAGFVPTVQTAQSAAAAARSGGETVLTGVAPVAATASLTFLIVLAVAVVSIFLDVLIVSARLPLLGGIAAIALLAVPAVIVPSDSDLMPATVAVVAMFALMHRTSTLRQRALGVPRSPVMARVTAAALTILTVLGAFLLTPALAWVGGSATVTGLGVGPTIDDSIDLGRDLRRPREAAVLTYRSDLTTPPNLRLATLSRLIGDIWTPDDGPTEALTWLDEMQPDRAAPGIAQTEHRASVQVGAMRSKHLPAPAVVASVEGVNPDQWRVMPENRTMHTDSSDASGQAYTVDFTTTEPTAPQMRAAVAALKGGAPALYHVPETAPESLRQLAYEVTAETTTDYDALLALQSWFRSDAFSYSLEAPLQEGFDGTSMRAMAMFLEVKSGYCVHYATAFTLMARELEMPARVVLGFLPGSATGDRAGGEPVYEVTTSQLHTWPEVYFDGIGWVSFEPTPGLGAPTDFPDDAAAAGSDEPTPTASAAPQATDRPDSEALVPSTGAGAGADDDGGGWLARALLIVAGVLVLACVPLAVRTILRARRRAAAAAGSAAAAWREARATLVDHGFELDPAESPRALAARVVREGIAPEAMLAPLVAGIERHSYAAHSESNGAELLAAVDGIRAACGQTRTGASHVRRALFPRSIFLPNGTLPSLRQPRADADDAPARRPRSRAPRQRG